MFQCLSVTKIVLPFRHRRRRRYNSCYCCCCFIFGTVERDSSSDGKNENI